MSTRDEHGREICSPERPYTPTTDQRVQWVHPEAVDVGECPEGCCDDFKCPVCGLKFRVPA